MLTKKSKLLIKEEIGDGVRRQGRSGRGFSFSRASISPVKEKLDSAAMTKPLRITRPGSDKNGSKSGRSLKKMSDCKGFSRLGNVPNIGTPDINDHACSSPFWKNMERIFTFVSSKDRSYLTQQLMYAEELQDSHDSDVLVDLVHEEASVSDTVCEKRYRRLQNQSGSKESGSIFELVDQSQDTPLFGTLDPGRIFNKVTPLYQRILSALIVEDDIEEYEEIDVGRNVLLQNATSDSPLAVSTNCFFALTGSFISSANGGPLSAVEVLSDQAFTKKGPISNRGKKKKVFLDDVVGNAALRTPSALGTSPLCGTKGKRNERERDKDTSTRNALPKNRMLIYG